MTPSSDFDDEVDRRPPDPEPTFADVLNGFSLDSGRRRRRRRHSYDEQEDEEPAMAPPAEPWEGSRPAEGEQWFEWDDDAGRGGQHAAAGVFGGSRVVLDELSDDAAMVRPYAWTRGRTRASVHFELETLVSTSERGCDGAALVQLEHRFVAELCRHPHAVAEVAAKLSVPLGVARVLLSDMAELGLIVVHQTVAEDDDTAAQLMLMERVLSGLRRL